MPIRAVLWDFGGVVSTSPFDGFRAYEDRMGLPEGFLRTLNATDPDTNAWARLERNEVSVEEFCEQFEAEARAAGGDRVVALDVLGLLAGDVRPAVVEAIRRCRAAGFGTALLTNNVVGFSRDGEGPHGPILDLFDVVVESSKVGMRKPDERFYRLACELLGIDPPEAVFLDDLGVNLKPARAMGMTTIKVSDPDAALARLESVLGIPLGDGAPPVG